MLTVQRYINGTLVQPGVLITSPTSSERVLGRMIAASGRCESLSPEQWTPVVCTGRQVLWEGEGQSSYEAADWLARQHASAALDRAVVDLFK